ncbi:MAG: ABC transporter ATP-binding protein [Chloroflexi bacterium]|nr:ABC transporter ATP-binding protein [Chloroflexota bacterium]
MEHTTVIHAEGLTRHFGDTIAVDRISFDVQAGEVFGFLGHNGAGKTTTIRVLNGVLDATAGKVEVLGLSPNAQGPALRRRTGVLTETPSLDDRLTARDNLRIYANLYDVPQDQVQSRVDEMLALFELSERADDKVGEFSKGMRQRLALARALIHQPELLFLDEPTSGLDPVASKQVRDLIDRLSEEGRTIFLCTHNLTEAQRLCDRVAVLEEGQIIALGNPRELGDQMGISLPLEIEVAADQINAACELLSSIEHATDVRARGSVINVSGLHRTDIPLAIERLVSTNIAIFQVTPGEASLESVYLALHRDEEAA